MKAKFLKLCFLSCIIISSMVMLGCATKNNLSSIISYAQKNFKDIDLQKENCIFLIGERGCIGCNQAMSRLATEYLNQDNVYFIINPQSDGRIVDISPYWEASNQAHISFDTIDYFNKRQFEYSYAFFIKNNKVDTIINIVAQTYETDVSYIKNRLKKKE